MGVTGVMMWAKVWVGNLLARWWVDVATAIHFYEAILATLAIVVWHFYQVFGDPDVYPMNWAWWDGKMSVEHYREEHALDTESLRNVEPGDRPAAIRRTHRSISRGLSLFRLRGIAIVMNRRFCDELMIVSELDLIDVEARVVSIASQSGSAGSSLSRRSLPAC